MLVLDDDFIHCNQPDCPAKIKNHYWGRVKAEGWFFGRLTDEDWCPDHLPLWVREWRKKMASRREKNDP